MSRGCGTMYVADGNWKLKYPHCMWKAPITVEGLNQVNYPNICPLFWKEVRPFANPIVKWQPKRKFLMDYTSSFNIVAFKVTVDWTIFQFYVVHASISCYCYVDKKGYTITTVTKLRSLIDPKLIGLPLLASFLYFPSDEY